MPGPRQQITAGAGRLTRAGAGRPGRGRWPRRGQLSRFAGRPAAASTAVALAAGLAIGGCGGGGGSRNTAAGLCSPGHLSSDPARPAAAGGTAGAARLSPTATSPGRPSLASGWALPGADLANTRDTASPITSANVSRLGVAWTAPINRAAGYAATPVVVHGVVYTQDLLSNVMAISLATGRVLWTHAYNSRNGGPDGVNVASGVVYAATSHAAVALSAATGRQLWSRRLTRNDHEGIDMAPGYHDGTVFVSTVPDNPVLGQYLGDAKAVLWALNAATGAPEWSWDEVQDLWGRPGINSGGGQWYAPSFDAQGNIYLGVANPGPVTGHAGYPWATSRPGPDLYTDSVVKLSPRGRLLWYYQLTPHDVHDWDLQDPPVLTMANGRPVVIDGGKAGILIELNAQTGQLIWRLPVGDHNGHDADGLLSEHAQPSTHIPLPATECAEPGGYGGIMSPLASNGTTIFAALNNLPMQYLKDSGTTVSGGIKRLVTALAQAPGEMVAVNQDTGQLEWADRLPSTPYGAATVTNNVVFTTTYSGYLYAFSAATGAVLLKRTLSAGSNSPLTVDGDYVIVGAAAPHTAAQTSLIIAYRLGAAGKLPDTVAPAPPGGPAPG